ncbi:MAG: apolipoprotein N-acyltransferase, partial [Pseudomonadales bacterium]
MLDQVDSFLQGKPRARDFLALAAGAVLPLSFAPFDYWFLSIVCIIALLLSLTEATQARGAWRFYLFAVGMYGTGVSWIYVSIHTYGGAGPLLAGFLVAGFVLSFSIISLLHGFVYMRFVRVLPLGLVVGFPCLWVIQEWFRTWLLTGFPWLFAGYAHLSTPLSGYGPVFGVLGISFAVMLTATLLYQLAWRSHPRRAVVLVGALAGIWLGGYGM